MMKTLMKGPRVAEEVMVFERLVSSVVDAAVE